MMRRFVSLMAFVLIGSAQAAPIATLSFDVSVMGYTRYGNTVEMLGSVAPGTHTTTTLTLPWTAGPLFRYNDAYAEHAVINMGAPQPTAGVQIVSPMLQALLDSAATQEALSAAFGVLGVTGMQPSPAFPYLARDYANIAKRDVHGVPEQDRYYTMFDATVMRPSYDLSGIGEARLLNMLRVNGLAYGAETNVDAFSLSDIGDMLRTIAASNRYGFTVQFTQTVDLYKNGMFVDRPFEITYGGHAQLIGFTIDGQDMLGGEVPEPSSELLLAFGLAGVIASRRKRRV